MKVICIDNKNESGRTSGGRPAMSHILKEGNVYTVVYATEILGDLCYGLAEINHPYEGCYWLAKRFVPISGIDETESEVYNNLQTVSV